MRSGILAGFFLVSLGGVVGLVACSTGDERPPVSSTTGSSGGSGGAGTDGAPRDASTDPSQDAGPMTLTSTAFDDGTLMPFANAKCTTDAAPTGPNASPPLVWANAPVGTLSYAVAMRDTSLPAPKHYHWVIYDIPASVTSLPAGVSPVAAPATPAGAKQTYWSFSNDYSYQGPCPPNGQHTYQFTVYALGIAKLPAFATPEAGLDPAAVDAVIQANKLASAKLFGKYPQ